MELIFKHHQHKGLNNRGENNSQQPMRVRREKVMRRFKLSRQLQCFTVVHDPLANLFMHCRYHTNAKAKRITRSKALLAWEAVSAAKSFSTGQQAA